MTADVLMVVVSYNDKVNTFRAIQSLKAQQDVDINVVVWDNASSDGSQDILMSIPGINVVLSKENKLWTPAINEAIESFYNGEKYIGFLNNDIAFIDPDTMKKLLDTAGDPHVGIVAPVGARLGGMQDFVSHPEDYSQDKAYTRAGYVVGACCVLRKKIWDLVGELDNTMPLGADDHDYCIRIKEMGFGVYVCQEAYVDHVGHASSGTVEGRQAWTDWAGKSWESFNNKWSGNDDQPYFIDQLEADLCHWGSQYFKGWDAMTGHKPKEYFDTVYNIRKNFHVKNLENPAYKQKVTDIASVIWDFTTEGL